MNIDDIHTEARGGRRLWFPGCWPILVVLSLMPLGAKPAFPQAVATPAPSVVRVVIDYHIYSATALPPKYSAYVTAATPKERVSYGVPCPQRPRAKGNRARSTFCVDTFYPRYPYHRLPPAVKAKLVSSIRRMGGELVDWAFSNGGFVGLGVNDDGFFLLVRVGGREKAVEALGPLDAPNDEIQAGMEDPHPFCFTDKESGATSLAVIAAKSLVRLAMAWRGVALVVCGTNGGETPFFLFPGKKVHEWWWNKPWAIDGGADGSRFPLCNVWWDASHTKPGSSEVILPVADPREPNRVQDWVTLDLETGRFLIHGKQIYPESPQGKSDDEKSPSARPSTGEGSSSGSRHPPDDNEHDGKQQVEGPDSD